MAVSKSENTVSSSDREMAEAGIIELEAPKRKTAETDTGGGEGGGGDPENNGGGEGEGAEGKTKIKAGAAAAEIPKNKEGEEGDDPENKDLKDKVVNFDDMSEEDIIKVLNKRTGKTFSSLTDLTKEPESKILTAEEQEQENEKRQADALKFGLDNKLFAKKDYDQFQVFKTIPKVDVVMEAFVKEEMAADKELSKEDAEERFKELYHQFDDETSFKYKKGLQQIEQQYEQIKNARFKNIVNVEDVYKGVEKNMANAKVYHQKLTETFNSIDKNLSFEIDGEKINAPLFTDEQVEKVKKNYLTPEMMASVLAEDGSIDMESLATEIRKDFIYDNLDTIVTEAAKTLADVKVKAAMKARKGANFTEEAHESDLPIDRNQKSPSDIEMEKAKEEGVFV